jgi:hypothetical protein
MPRTELLTSFSIKALPFLVRWPKANGVLIAFSTVSGVRDHFRQLNEHVTFSVLEHGSEKHRKLTLDHLLDGLLEFATNEQGSKSITKALKEGGKETLDRIIKRMCEPAKGYVSYSVTSIVLTFEKGSAGYDSGPCVICDWQSIDCQCIADGQASSIFLALCGSNKRLIG